MPIKKRFSRHDWKHAKSHHLLSQAQGKLSYAISIGLLTAPKRCEDSRCKHNRITGHHEDYAYPLMVIWLCPKCHYKRHVYTP